jgi:hypothetical protein
MRLASVCYWCRRRLSCDRSEGLVFGAFSKRSSQLKRKLCVRSERQQSPALRPVVWIAAKVGSELALPNAAQHSKGCFTDAIAL